MVHHYDSRPLYVGGGKVFLSGSHPKAIKYYGYNRWNHKVQFDKNQLSQIHLSNLDQSKCIRVQIASPGGRRGKQVNLSGIAVSPGWTQIPPLGTVTLLVSKTPTTAVATVDDRKEWVSVEQDKTDIFGNVVGLSVNTVVKVGMEEVHISPTSSHLTSSQHCFTVSPLSCTFPSF